jgi:hypothetical protein
MNSDDFWCLASFMMDAYAWTGISLGWDDMSGDLLLYGGHAVRFHGQRPSVGDHLQSDDGALVRVTSVAYRSDEWRVTIEVSP